MNANNNESRFHSCISRWLVLLGLTGILASPVASALEYVEFVDLGVDVSPTDINNNRVVVGSVGSYPTTGFQWIDGARSDLAGTTVANSINNDGWIAGNTPAGAFRLIGGSLTNLGDGYTAGGINASGVVAGSHTGENPYRSSPLPINPAVYDGSTWHEVDVARLYRRGTRDGVYADQYVLFGNNDTGDAVGRKIKAGIAGSAAILVTYPWTDVIFLPIPYGGYASAINNEKIAGTTGTNTGTGDYAQAFLCNISNCGDSIEYLGTLYGGLTSSAADINDNDQTVGTSWLVTQLTSLYDPEMYHAFLKEPGQPMADLNDLDIMNGSGWILTVATAINNNGDIVGTGLFDEDGDGAKETHGFLLLSSNSAWASPPAPPIQPDPPPETQVPVAKATAGPNPVPARQLVTFSDNDSYDPDGGDILSYMWDFGDGKSASGPSVDHAYKRAGGYTATLTVTDDEGESNTAELQITVLKKNGR
jgi:uncharacterized membrane protein